MTRAEGSTSQRLRPCSAERGNAWWLWCHASPIEGIASQATLVDLSSISNRRRPKKWQIELIDQVTWCRKNARTRPPQTRPRSAPSSVKPWSAQPSSVGMPIEASASHGNIRPMRRMPGSS